MVEYLTGRPTLGCRGNPTDIPIHRHGMPALSHVAGVPVAEKVHYIAELRAVEETDKIDGVILIRRDPAEAILSHVGRRPRFGFFYQRKVEQACTHYFYLINEVDDSTYPRLVVNFDELISDDRSVYGPMLDAMIRFLGDRVLPERADELRANYLDLRKHCYGILHRPATTTGPAHHRRAADPISLKIVAEQIDLMSRAFPMVIGEIT